MLYPPIEPFDRRMIDVGDGHTVYVEQCGRRDGIPVIVLHGGPGGGCSPGMRRFFNPRVFRVVLFDQRGCGRSRPSGEVRANTTAHLIADITRIRELLGLERVILFGGSWGSTLALAYAQAEPGAVAYLALRGVFLATRAELEWFYGGGAARFFPREWEEFCAPIPPEERDDLIAAYHRRLFSGDRALETRCAQAWTAWENRLAALPESGGGLAPPDYARVFARLECHYFINGAFLPADGALIEGMARIRDLPGVIVHGRYDMICPPAAAWRLKGVWPAGELTIVPEAGHALSEPGIAGALVEAMDRIAAAPAALGFRL